MKPSIASVIDATEPEGDEGMDMPADKDGDEGTPSPEEVSAVKLFERAKTTEEKASALKMFVKACMPGAY